MINTRKLSQYVYFLETDKSIVDRVRPIELPTQPFAIIIYSDKGEQGKITKVTFTEFIDIYGFPEKTSHVTKKSQYELVKTGNRVYVINISGVTESKKQTFTFTKDEITNKNTLDSTVEVSKTIKGTSLVLGDRDLMIITTKYFGTYTNKLKFKVKFEQVRVGNNKYNLATISVYKATEVNGKRVFKLVEEFNGYLDSLLVDEDGNSLFLEKLQEKSKYIRVKVNPNEGQNFDFEDPVTYEVSFVRDPGDPDYIGDKFLQNDEIKDIINEFDDETDFKYFVEGGQRTLRQLWPSFDVNVIRSEMIKKCEELMSVYIQDFYGLEKIEHVKQELTSFTPFAQAFFPDTLRYVSYDDEFVVEQIPISVDVAITAHRIDESYGQYYPASGMLQKLNNQLDLTVKIKKRDRDVLYSSNINPITKLFNEGIFIWGNKTTYAVESKLEQLHVRRLLNFMVVRPLKSKLLPYIFKPMTPAYVYEIASVVNDHLLELKQRGQLDDQTYKIKTVGTEVWITLNLKPVNAIEYIIVHMIILPSEGITIEGGTTTK